MHPGPNVLVYGESLVILHAGEVEVRVSKHYLLLAREGVDVRMLACEEEDIDIENCAKNAVKTHLQKPAFNLPGNPPTRTRGTGMARVEKKTQPVPLPLRTLPATRAGSKTLDNPYQHTWSDLIQNHLCAIAKTPRGI